MMEIEFDLENESTPEYMKLPKYKFMLTLPAYNKNKSLKQKLMTAIVDGNMTPYYIKVCADLKYDEDPELINKMTEANLAELRRLQDNEESGIPDDLGPKLWIPRLEYLFSIGDLPTARELINTKMEDKTENLSTMQRFDCYLTLFRIAMFNDLDIKGMKEAMKNGKIILEKSSSDWCAANKMKVYEAIYCLAVRKFEEATALLIECALTFESYELIDFSGVVQYTILSAMLTLPRTELRERLQSRGSIMQALYSDHRSLKEYVDSLYECRYGEFMHTLKGVSNMMGCDPLLQTHCRYYTREMRLKAFHQQLTAYRSLRIDAMAATFGMNPDDLEEELARFITAGRLPVKIDKVSGCIVRPICDQVAADQASFYQDTIRKGDILLNRIKKLARVVDF